MTPKPAGNVRRIDKKFRVALVSMPWSIFNRPSIQLGALKAYLNSEIGWASVNNFHPYLDVAKYLGTAVYHEISLNFRLCESLYASLVFPEQRSAAQKVFDKEKRRSGLIKKLYFDEIVRCLQEHLEDFIDAVDWAAFHLVGFTVCFNQLFSTLATIKYLRKKRPEVAIVVGGSACPDDLAAPLLNLGEIDYVISGEGEQKLAALCEFLSARTKKMPWGIHARHRSARKPEATVPLQLQSLAGLPVPDYDDYFLEMRRVFAHGPFIPVLPVEFSRGCWWRKCVFCNLNLQWQGYRAKESTKMYEEVLGLSEKYGSLDFAFTDNALPMTQAHDFFDRIAGSARGLNFFGEIRATMRGKKMANAGRGGLTVVQVGIEALSSSLLAKMVKGTTVIENIAVMKDALAAGVRLEGNLIVEFPGSTPAEVEETLKNLEFVLPFMPLATAVFFLGHGSPVAKDPGKYGIKALAQHPILRKIMPPGKLPAFPMLIKGYRGDHTFQKKLWRPVIEQVKKWQTFHRERKCKVMEQPALSFRDGGRFMIIRQELSGRETMHHTLRGLSREIYLACGDICEFEILARKFSRISREKLMDFLADLVDKRLVFRENDKYLALAVKR